MIETVSVVREVPARTVTETKFRCTECGTEFSWEGEASRHVEAMHSGPAVREIGGGPILAVRVDDEAELTGVIAERFHDGFEETFHRAFSGPLVPGWYTAEMEIGTVPIVVVRRLEDLIDELEIRATTIGVELDHARRILEGDDL